MSRVSNYSFVNSEMTMRFERMFVIIKIDRLTRLVGAMLDSTLVKKHIVESILELSNANVGLLCLISSGLKS